MAGPAAVARFHAWQTARLHAQAAMTRALCHDLRGMLAPGLLVAERLQASTDPAQRTAGDRVAAVVTRATERLRPDLEAAMDLGAHTLETVTLDQLTMAMPPGLALVRDLPAGIMVRINGTGFAAAFAELTANCTAAGARTIRVSAAAAGRHLVILLRDDGPGLPDIVSFAPPSGPDDPIGLALARDLLRGMGADLRAVPNGPGAEFEITLARG
jgi:signal transduction histidine kinase